MLSRFTTETADVTVEALAMGAFDAVAKPAGGSPEESRQELLRKLRDVIDAVRSGGGFDPAVPPSGGLEPTECDVIVVASSTGGPDALQTVLAGLPDSLTVPVVIVQHLPAGFIDSLARRLNNVCRLPVLVPKDGDSLTPGAVFLAPGGRHLGLAEGGVMYLLDSPPLHGCRPAADLLFQSAAEAFGRRTLGIVLTGMGRDGTEGAGAIRATGGRVIAQHSDGCTVYGMPKSVVAAGQADAVIPLPEIASTVAGAVR